MQERWESLARGVAALTGMFMVIWLVWGNFSYQSIRWIAGLYLASTALLFYYQSENKKK